MKNWQEEYHEIEEYQRVFYLMDSTMKYIHENNYQIANFDGNEIILGFDDQTKEINYVLYQSLLPFSNEAVEEMHRNIYNLAFLAIGIYSSTLPYLKPEFLKENFSQFEYSLPKDDIRYYRDVITRNNYFYYSDFVNARNEREINTINKDLEKLDGNGSSKGRSMTKATVAGRYMSDAYDHAFTSDDNKTAAFVTRFVLSFIIIALSLLIPIMAYIFGMIGK